MPLATHYHTQVETLSPNRSKTTCQQRQSPSTCLGTEVEVCRDSSLSCCDDSSNQTPAADLLHIKLSCHRPKADPIQSSRDWFYITRLPHPNDLTIFLSLLTTHSSTNIFLSQRPAVLEPQIGINLSKRESPLSQSALSVNGELYLPTSPSFFQMTGVSNGFIFCSGNPGTS